MRARFVNEIKRDIESSGLDPIRVGKTAMYIPMVAAEFKKLQDYNKDLYNYYSYEVPNTNEFGETIVILFVNNYTEFIDFNHLTKEFKISMQNNNWAGDSFKDYAIIEEGGENDGLFLYKFDVIQIIKDGKLEEVFDIIRHAVDNFLKLT